MNTPNNKRRRDSQDRMIKVLVDLLRDRDLKQVTVTDICRKAGVNRSTFYSNYMDVFDLADSVQQYLEQEVESLYTEEKEHSYNSNNYLKLFNHIKENQGIYKTYFKLGADERFRKKSMIYDTVQAKEYYDNKYIEYHIEFFRNGVTAIIKKWLAGGCVETPEEIQSIIKAEYMPKKIE